MRLTRHAKNRRRLYALELREIELIVRGGRRLAPDPRGNVRIVGSLEDGREFVVVVALDNPNLVITLIERRER